MKAQVRSLRRRLRPVKPYLAWLRDGLVQELAHAVLRGVTPDRFGVTSWETRRLQYAPRYWLTSSPLLGRRIALTDPHWYLYCYREIFLDEIYRFVARRSDPLVIDCGANIGLSVIYFKYLYPTARVIAFEPDGYLVEVLRRNLATYALSDVAVYQQAVWHDNTTLHFAPDHSVGGHVVDETQGDHLIEVDTFRLRDLLDQPVDFLKLDIEGAEYEVLRDCADRLGNVDYLFVEYHGKLSAPQWLDEALRILTAAGFRYHIRESYPTAHPFLAEERRELYYDLVLNIFGYRND